MPQHEVLFFEDYHAIADRVLAEDSTVVCAACGELADESEVDVHDICGECRDDQTANVEADPFNGLDTLDEYRQVFAE